MSLDDKIVPYLQMAGLYHLARLNETWFKLDEPLETFCELSQGADDEMVRKYTRAYIMMLLSMQLFEDKSGTCLHICWLPYVAKLEDMGQYSWGSTTLSWLYRCICRVANRNVVKLASPLQLLQSWIFWRFPGFRLNGFDVFYWLLALRWVGYQPTLSDKGPRIVHWRLWIDLLQSGDVMHTKILEPRNMELWRVATALIYFTVIEWYQVDRVLPQFSGVQHQPCAALNIDFLMSKDGRGGGR
ncbi:serine/threonine-protein phosphatase 7 long form homolog [Arachis hypogaea]|uniref:serine/threonine-protein phosphatase 7 long form homolog n=1 Tax=Arachis hypogaea TaxID=3818 RepID=UPI003B20CE33